MQPPKPGERGRSRFKAHPQSSGRLLLCWHLRGIRALYHRPERMSRHRPTAPRGDPTRGRPCLPPAAWRVGTYCGRCAGRIAARETVRRLLLFDELPHLRGCHPPDRRGHRAGRRCPAQWRLKHAVTGTPPRAFGPNPLDSGRDTLSDTQRGGCGRTGEDDTVCGTRALRTPCSVVDVHGHYMWHLLISGSLVRVQPEEPAPLNLNVIPQHPSPPPPDTLFDTHGDERLRM
jgi:hypothetical protein